MYYKSSIDSCGMKSELFYWMIHLAKWIKKANGLRAGS